MSMSIEIKFGPTNEAEYQAAIEAVKAVEQSLNDTLEAAGQTRCVMLYINQVKTRTHTIQIHPTPGDFGPYESKFGLLTCHSGVHVDEAPKK